MTGIKVSDYIRPISTNDTYPTHLDIFGKGGLHSVTSVIERNSITQERRKLGMFSYVNEENTLYALLNGVANENWVKLLNYDGGINFNISCKENYILIGDKNNIVRQSPILIDIRQDIIDLRRGLGKLDSLDKLDHNRIWIGDYTNRPEEKLQIGIINLPILSEALFPNPISELTGDFRIPNPTFDYLSPFDWVMSGPFLPQIYATKYNTLGNPVGTDVSSSLAMTQVRTAQIMKRFDNANFIVGSSTVDFAWENPKMYLIPEQLKQLYGLGTTYTFTKAQSLGALETGLLKNTVNNGSGTLSKAISGEDYVNTADIPIGNLVILDPLYPTLGHKLISPTAFKVRKNNPNEFGEPIPNKLNILEGPIANLIKLAITSLAIGSLVKVGTAGELITATKNTDYVAPDVIADITNKLNTLSLLVKCVIGVQASVNIADITLNQATNLNKVVKTIVGVKDTVDMVDVTFSQANALTTAVKNAVGVAETAEIVDLTAKTATLATNAASLVEIEAQIAALAGVQTITVLGGILGFIFTTFGGYEYGQYIRGQSLNVKNTWRAADLNDEGHNAVGDYEFRFPSGYSSDDRGHGTLWFDSDGRSSDHKSEAGLRLFSWDSGGDHLGYDSPIAPLHIGIFGYQNKYHTWPFSNPTAKYKGFIFSIPEFHNENSSDDDYRFPKKFGLYDVTRTIGTWTSNKYGWDSKNTIFEYDYNNFTFFKNVKHNNYVNFQETVDFQKYVKFLTKEAIKIPVGNIAERPSNPEAGMIRYNTEI